MRRIFGIGPLEKPVEPKEWLYRAASSEPRESALVKNVAGLAGAESGEAFVDVVDAFGGDFDLITSLDGGNKWAERLLC